MLGHKWEPAQGTIVEASSGSAAGHSGVTHPEHHYVIEVRKPTGEVVRGNVTERGIFSHAVGSMIGVEVNSKTNEIRVDPNAATFSPATMMNASGPIGGPGQMAGPGGPTGALAAALGAAMAGMSSVRVIGPGGQELPADSAAAEELRNLMHAMVSGDPAAQQAARERLHQLRAQAAGQGPGRPAPGAPSSFGSFDTSGGHGATEERLARLKQLFDKGIVTESEYQAQRQQIISGI